MGKLALNFICKNEAHIIERMLYSAKDITDLIVAVDTGSSDETKELIYKFGLEHNIPTFVFDRVFDNFENSRNYAISMLMERATYLGWNLNKSHGYWFDCDETLVIDVDFDKNQFVNDFYMIDAKLNDRKFTRNTFFRLSKSFRFYGPIHEYLTTDEEYSQGLAKGIYVDVKMEGASWKGDIASKYKEHAFILEKYIDDNRKDPRWIFYTAQSWYDSSCVKNNRIENEERLRRALYFYRERVSRLDGYSEERYYSQYRIGVIMSILEEPWVLTKNELLKAYSLDTLRVEPFRVIVNHYLSIDEYEMAYIYSTFSIKFVGQNPYPKRLLSIDVSLYDWKLLETHVKIALLTKRKDEAMLVYNKLLKLSENQPMLFTEADIKRIQSMDMN